MIPFPINEETSDKFPLTEETTEKTTEKNAESIILREMRSNPYVTQKQLAIKCGLTEDGVYYVVSKLRRSGVVKRVGGRKLGHWEVLV